jgi:uncharacterized membrane protein YidH (DUF202 family)
MKNFLLTLLAVIAAGVLAAGAFFRWQSNDALHAAAQERDAMKWLRTEFHLSDAQFAAIAKLHEDYSVECADHCAAIGSTRAQLAAAEKSGQPVATIAVLRRAVAERELACRSAIGAHLRKVAALMPPGEGERYLQMLLPRVENYRHQGAPTVRLDG